MSTRNLSLRAVLALCYCLSAWQPALAGPAEWQKLMDAGQQAIVDRDLAKAETSFQDAVKEAEKFGPKDPRLADSLDSLGAILGVTGKFDRAESLVKQALDIKKTNKSTSLQSLNSTRFDLANIYYNQKRYDLAEPIYKEVVEGAESDPVLKTKEALILQLLYLGDCYAHNKKPALAEVTYKKTLVLMNQKMGVDSKLIIPVLNKLSDVMYEQSKFSEALPYMEQEAKLLEKHDNVNSVVLALVLNNLADAYLKTGKLTEAETSAKRSLAILKENLNPDDGAHIAVLDTMAEVYRAQKKFDEAEPLFKRALSIAEFSGDDGKPNLVTAMKHYAELLRQTKRDSEALALEAELKKIEQP